MLIFDKVTVVEASDSPGELIVTAELLIFEQVPTDELQEEFE
jgi:hypothetical protein